MIKPVAASSAAIQPKAARTLVPVRQAMLGLLRDLAPVAPVAIALDDALGCVLAEAVSAPGPLPAEATALRAGYALCATETFGASPYGPLPLAAPPVWVEAGQALPEGCDALADADAVVLRRGRAELGEPVVPGNWVRRAGDDAAAGSCLRAASERMRPLDLVLARAAGLTHVRVRRPRLLLVETLASHTPCGDLIARMALASGSAVVRVQAEAIEDEQADVIVMLGEPSRLQAALPPSAVRVADGLALHPGDAACLVRVDHIPVLIVPPLVDAVLALRLTVAAPLLRHLAAAMPEPSPPAARLTGKIVSTIGFTEIVLLRRTEQGLEPLATGSLPLAAMAAAESWLAVEPGQEGYPAGHPVIAWPL